MALIIAFPKWITLLVGGGLIGVGVMVFVFLVKFLFATSKVDESDSIEINKESQPELVAFIHQIAEETNTPKPKRILLSSDVNACVFYHSSFWSMFLPVKKNLKIGLGLINAVNKSELKAVVAHEFGHFSQRSMKLGSYTYHVNKIIHDMLFNNTGYANTLSAWSRVHGVFNACAQLTLEVVKAIQWVLMQAYKMVNKSYLGLSRQMEFHADLVAASVSGSNNIIAALYRIEVADACYTAALNIGDKVWKEDQVIGDMYAGQTTVLNRVAAVNKWTVVQGLPIIDQERRAETTSRVTFKNQWASHPTTIERKEYLDQFELQAEVDHTPAWSLLKESQTLRVRLTKLLYRNLTIDTNKQVLDAVGFDTVYAKQVTTADFPEVYKGYYNDRLIHLFDTNPNQEQNHSISSLEQLLTPAALALPKQIETLVHDVEVLKAIAAGQVDTKTFDFDGQKYKRSEATVIQQTLENELKQYTEELALTDKRIYQLSYKTTPLGQAEHLRKQYDQYFTYRQQAEQFWNDVHAIMQPLHPIYAGQTLGLETINTRISKLKEKDERQLKEALQYWAAEGAFDQEPGLKEKVEGFIQSQYAYFSGNSFFENELMLLNEVVQECWNGIDRFLVHQFQELLEYQTLCLATSVSQPLVG
jgi:Zn-dependent protease with chaperone function